ncbi:MAG: HAMP domain-containing protein [Hyphomicrobium sp.]
MSLRQQLLGTIALVLFGTLMLGAFLTYRHALNKIETEMHAAIAVGSRIAHNAVDDAEEVVNPRLRLKLLVADFNGDRHLRVSMIDPNGEVLEVSQLSPVQDRVPAWLHRLLSRAPTVAKLDLPEVFKSYGSIQLQTDAHNEIAEVWDDVKLFLTILSIFCATGLLVTLLVLGRALHPLRILTTAFERIGRGDYGPRMQEAGPREFVSLASGFNKMAGHLSDMESRNRGLLVQLEAVQEEERAELARNLHDEVSPLLFCVGVDAMAIQRLASDRPHHKIAEHAKSIQDAVGNMKGNVKSILGELRPSNVHALGLHGAIDELIEFWKGRHPQLSFAVEIPDTSWGTKIDGAVQAIVGESVNNALKHSSPRRVKIVIKEIAEMLVVEVSDDGGGLKATASHERGFGILGMKERAQNIGGMLTVSNASDMRGVIVHAQLPVRLLPPSDLTPDLPGAGFAREAAVA